MDRAARHSRVEGENPSKKKARNSVKMEEKKLIKMSNWKSEKKTYTHTHTHTNNFHRSGFSHNINLNQFSITSGIEILVKHST